MADMARLSATVYGRVQGVFFRYFVRNEARGLGLKGG
jgi:acylphosphatase